MKKLFFAMTCLCISLSAIKAQSGTMVRIKALGSSPRGQYVAFEEFGYLDGVKLPYSKIRIRNMWKNKEVEKPIEVIGRGQDARLNAIRQKAKDLAHKKFQKFNITT